MDTPTKKTGMMIIREMFVPYALIYIATWLYKKNSRLNYIVRYFHVQNNVSRHKDM